MPTQSSRRLSIFAFAAMALCAAGHGQNDVSPAVAVSKARSLYYTPVDRGLQSFHCDVSFDWKAFTQKATNQPVPDDDPRLKYLRTIQLSVDDTLRGPGELHWTATDTPPEGTAEAVSRMKDGLQQIWSSFFQSWNAYMTGSMVTLDTTETVTPAEDGYRVATQDVRGSAEQRYSSKLLLESIHIVTPTLETTVVPSFTPSPQGLLLSGMHSTYRQTGGPASEVVTTVHYAEVNSFELPSELQVDAGAASFDFHTSNCTVTTQFTPVRPQRGLSAPVHERDAPAHAPDRP